MKGYTRILACLMILLLCYSLVLQPLSAEEDTAPLEGNEVMPEIDLEDEDVAVVTPDPEVETEAGDPTPQPEMPELDLNEPLNQQEPATAVADEAVSLAEKDEAAGVEISEDKSEKTRKSPAIELPLLFFYPASSTTGGLESKASFELDLTLAFQSWAAKHENLPEAMRVERFVEEIKEEALPQVFARRSRDPGGSIDPFTFDELSLNDTERFQKLLWNATAALDSEDRLLLRLALDLGAEDEFCELFILKRGGTRGPLDGFLPFRVDALFHRSQYLRALNGNPADFIVPSPAPFEAIKLEGEDKGLFQACFLTLDPWQPSAEPSDYFLHLDAVALNQLKEKADPEQGSSPQNSYLAARLGVSLTSNFAEKKLTWQALDSYINVRGLYFGDALAKVMESSELKSEGKILEPPLCQLGEEQTVPHDAAWFIRQKDEGEAVLSLTYEEVLQDTEAIYSGLDLGFDAELLRLRFQAPAEEARCFLTDLEGLPLAEFANEDAHSTRSGTDYVKEALGRTDELKERVKSWQFPTLQCQEGYELKSWNVGEYILAPKAEDDLRNLLVEALEQSEAIKELSFVAQVERSASSGPSNQDTITLIFKTAELPFAEGLNKAEEPKGQVGTYEVLVKGNELSLISALPKLLDREDLLFDAWVPEADSTRKLRSVTEFLNYLKEQADKVEFIFNALTRLPQENVEIKFVVPEKYKALVSIGLYDKQTKEVLNYTTADKRVLIQTAAKTKLWKDVFGEHLGVAKVKYGSAYESYLLLGFDPNFDRYQDRATLVTDKVFTAVFVPADESCTSGDPVKDELLKEIHRLHQAKKTEAYEALSATQKLAYDDALIQLGKLYNQESPLLPDAYKDILDRLLPHVPSLPLNERTLTDPRTQISVTWFFEPWDQLVVQPVDPLLLNRTGKVEAVALYDIFILRNGRRLVFHVPAKPKIKVGIPVPPECMTALSPGVFQFKDGYTVYHVSMLEDGGENKASKLSAVRGVKIEPDRKAWFFTDHLSFWAIARPKKAVIGQDGKVDAAALTPSKTTKIPATGESGLPLLLAIGLIAFAAGLVLLRKHIH